MIETGRTYVVMGLLNTESIAFAIGRTLARLGGRVIYTIQDHRLRARYLDRSPDLSPEELAQLDCRVCDVTRDDQVAALFAGAGPVAGVVHSLAFANPETCLGQEFHTAALEDILKSYHVSAVSLATVARHAAPNLRGGGSIVALSFETSRAFAVYNWMGVHKSALEAIVRALARRHGRDLIRVNAVSAGPLATRAASRIPGFEAIQKIWQETSPLPWDVFADRQAVADAVAFLLGPHAAKITGQVLKVDGGASVVGGALQDYELPAPAACP